MRGGRVMGQDTFPVGSGSRANVVCTLIAVGYVSVVLDSVVKLKTCYNLFTYNEERAYGGTSKT